MIYEESFDTPYTLQFSLIFWNDVNVFRYSVRVIDVFRQKNRRGASISSLNAEEMVLCER